MTITNMQLISTVVSIIFIIFISRLLLIPRYFFFYPIIFNVILVCTSLIYIEHGGFISEAGRNGTFTGSSFVYIYFTILYFLGVKFAFSFTNKKTKNNLPSFAKIKRKSSGFKTLYMVAFISFLILYVNLFLSPIPLLNVNVDRFTYWKYSALPFLHILFGNVTTIFAFVFGYLYWYFSYAGRLKKSLLVYKRLVFFSFISYIIYLVFLGHKFSAIETSIFYFILPFVAWVDGRIKLNKKVISYATVVVALLFGLVYFNFSKFQYYSYISKNVFVQIGYRVVGLQGGLWWSMFNAIVNCNFRPTYNVHDLLKGMDHLMYLESGYAPNVTEFIKMGGKYTNAYPAILLYIFPTWIASIVQVIIGSITGFFTLYVCSCIQKLNIIRAVLSVQLLMWLFYAEIQAYFVKIISPYFFCFLLIIILIELQSPPKTRRIIKVDLSPETM